MTTTALSRLHPAYFAMPMATGVVSIAARLLGWSFVAEPLLWVNVVVYVALWTLTIMRAVLHTKSFFADWSDHVRGVGFFTIVAATSVLGTQLVVLRQALGVAMVLWWIAAALWMICTYAIFTALTVRETKPGLADGIHGGWLVAVVATQSICVLGCLVSPAWGSHRAFALFGMLVFWLFGGMLYIWTISLIFYRYTFFRFVPSDLMPPYWVNMGAMAISTLAGVMLVRNAAASPLLTSLLPFLKGFTLFFWATATWWIPMLVILAVWRHAVKRFPLEYDPLYWGAVFPLAMYTTSTFHLASAFEIPALLAVPRVFFWIALGAWTITFLGLAKRITTSIVRVATTRLDVGVGARATRRS